MTETFEERIAAVQQELKASGKGDSLIERALMAGVFPTLRKRAKGNPDGMRREVSGILARIVFLLGLTPEEIFPPRPRELPPGS